jgi:hypothetical protein
MARAAGFHTYKTWRELAEEWDYLSPSQRSPDNDLARAAERVNLKDALGQVEADSRDLHRGGSKLVLRDSTTMALRRREREPSTPSALERAGVGSCTSLIAKDKPRDTPEDVA